jgi:hypothetical protein
MRYSRRVEETPALVPVIRYTALALVLLVAARSVFRLAARNINTPAFLAALTKLVDANNAARAAKLTRAAEVATVSRLVARALSLRVHAVAPPTGEQGHFRDGGSPGEPFELGWRREMDAAQNSLRMEVMTDTVAAAVAGSIGAAIAAIGAASTAESSWRSANIGALGVALLGVFVALRTGSSTLSGLVAVRAFCERIKRPVEEFDADRIEAARIAEGVWLKDQRSSSGDGTDP